jgi:hypothetical protein
MAHSNNKRKRGKSAKKLVILREINLSRKILPTSSDNLEFSVVLATFFLFLYLLSADKTSSLEFGLCSELGRSMAPSSIETFLNCN